jgi:NADH:ubiquinone oxidoreductase subunit F (NADH-binding)
MSLHQHALLPDAPITSYEQYLRWAGEDAIAKARAMGADAVVQEVQRSGLRGRGGAGFPTGVKWTTIKNHSCPTRYVVCNAAEGEPGTFKDRYLLRKNPYATLEGMLIAADVVGARECYVALKGSFTKERARLEQARGEIAAAGLLGYHEVHFVDGPEEYLFGEEKALLEVIEGNDPLPREPHYPPYEKGLFATPVAPNPALVNNVQTFAHIPSIIRHGSASFHEIGSRDAPGTLLFTVSGAVQRPGVYELPSGVSLRVLFEEVAGGPRPGRTLRAAICGVSTPILMAEKFDVAADFASLALAGSGLGSAGFIVFDDADDMRRVTQALARFLYVESCNQCSACKHGLGAASSAIDELFDPKTATLDDFDRALFGARSAPQGNRCYLPVQGSIVIPSLLTRFHAEFDALLAGMQAAVAGGPIPATGSYVLPKMVDFDEASRSFSYDVDQARKLPNWTYAPLPAAPPPSIPKPAQPGRPPKPPTNVRIAPDLREPLAEAARASGRDVERVVDEAVRAWLDRRT